MRTFYGGRTISREDIEAALLVGKGPREIRRLRKKKGAYIDKLIKKIEAFSVEMNGISSTGTSVLKFTCDSSSSRASIDDDIDLQEGMPVPEVSSGQCENRIIESVNNNALFTENSLCMNIRSFDIEDIETTAHQGSSDENEPGNEAINIENENLKILLKKRRHYHWQ